MLVQIEGWGGVESYGVDKGEEVGGICANVDIILYGSIFFGIGNLLLNNNDRSVRGLSVFCCLDKIFLVFIYCAVNGLYSFLYIYFKMY